MLTNVATLLGAVQDALHLFHTVSYYKVNATKLYILDLGIESPPETENAAKLSFV